MSSEVISAADWQMCCSNELADLDGVYCDLLPDLYKNMPQDWASQPSFIFECLLFAAIFDISKVYISAIERAINLKYENLVLIP